jgi:hypothetical protein
MSQLKIHCCVCQHPGEINSSKLGKMYRCPICHTEFKVESYHRAPELNDVNGQVKNSGSFMNFVYTVIGFTLHIGWAVLSVGLILFMISLCFTDPRQSAIANQEQKQRQKQQTLKTNTKANHSNASINKTANSTPPTANQKQSHSVVKGNYSKAPPPTQADIERGLEFKKQQQQRMDEIMARHREIIEESNRMARSLRPTHSVDSLKPLPGFPHTPNFTPPTPHFMPPGQRNTNPPPKF